MKSMKYLIDADIYAYRASSLAEREIEWAPDLWTLTSDVEESMGRFELAVARDLHAIGANIADAIMVFSDHGKTWRHWENPNYKSNRKGKRKPLAYRPLLERVVAAYPHDIRPGLEADDVLGIRGTSEDVVLVSIDKDMLTLPATVFNPDKDNIPRTYTEEEADRAFWTQALTGDATDGYPGCPGVGPVTAAKILDKAEPGEEWEVVVAAYEKAYGKAVPDYTPEELFNVASAAALLNARMARICRHGEWDATRKEMTWSPC